MSEDTTTGLIDVSEVDLADLKLLDIPAILRAWQRCAEEGGTVAGFQSAI
jgi:FXSXX-COOH protein